LSVNRIFIEEVSLRESKEKTEELVKGDQLRDLILLVDLNNKHGKGKNEIPALKEILNYSTGGIYHALNNSGYFERTTEGIQLTEKGKKYLEKKILPRFTILHPIGNFLIFIGVAFLFDWFAWNYLSIALVAQWYSGIIGIVCGIIVRFYFLRLYYWIVKRTKKISY
jgi:hypothetical protein